MPALSPTMTQGTIAKWTCKVGDKISPGDSLAEVETDKASMTFEAQDDFYIAKFLVEGGSEVKVGEPILVTVEDAANIGALASFVAPKSAAAPSAAASESAPVATPVAAPVAKPAAAPVAPVAAPVAAAPPAPKPVAAAPAPAAKPAPAAVPSGLWGRSVAKSPLSSKLSADQKAYIAKYGRASQKPISV